MKFKVYFPTYDPVTLLRFSKIDIDRVHDTFLPISPEIQLRLSLSLSLFSLLVSLGEASRTRIETMAEKRYRGTGASWQGRTTTSRMLLYVGNTSFILRSISVSTLERKPPCPLFSLPSSPSLSLSLSRFLLLNSVSTRSFDFSRNIGVSRLVVRRNYVSCWGKKLNVRFNSIERFHSIWRYQKFFSFFHFGKWV